MNKKTFGETLRSLREREKLSVKAVIEELKKYGQDITDKTLYSYENDKRAASADMLLALCQIYRCNNILETFAGIEPDYSIPDDCEWRLIEKYRSLDPYGQETVNIILNREVERVSDLGKKNDRISELEALADNPAAVVGFPKNRASIYIAYYQRMASAGSGEYLFSDVPTDLIEVPGTSAARQADFVLGVNGHSMEPTYYDNEKVFVKKAVDISDGEIGIFTRGNECFIKEKGADRLISHNPDKASYPDIPQSEDIRLVGIVIGKVKE